MSTLPPNQPPDQPPPDPEPQAQPAPTAAQPTYQVPPQYGVPQYNPPPGGYRPPPGAPPPVPPSRPPAARSGGNTCLIVAVVVLVCLVGFFAMLVALVGKTPTAVTTWPGTSGQTVGVIRITGIIMGGAGASSLFGAGTGSETVTAQLRRAAKDDSVRALIIRINSPGGSAAASQEIYQAIRDYEHDTRRPVIASMGDVAASGGYYAAAAANKIVAAPATMTGSIGVVMETMDYHDLMQKFGVSGGAITSGKYKDAGSPFRKMTPDERQLFQAMIDDVYDQFVDAVVEGRSMKKDEVKRLADGRVYTGRQALKVKLVDQLGTFRDAIRLAKDTAGIRGEPTVKFFERTTVLGALLGDMDSLAPQQQVPAGLLFDSRLWPIMNLGTPPPTPRAQ